MTRFTLYAFMKLFSKTVTFHSMFVPPSQVFSQKKFQCAIGINHYWSFTLHLICIYFEKNIKMNYVLRALELFGVQNLCVFMYICAFMHFAGFV